MEKTKKTPVKKVAKQEKTVEKDFKITLQINGETFTAEADENNLHEVVYAMKPNAYKTKAILTVEKGDMKIERVYFGLHTRRIFNHPLSVLSLIKTIKAGLK